MPTSIIDAVAASGRDPSPRGYADGGMTLPLGGQPPQGGPPPPPPPGGMPPPPGGMPPPPMGGPPPGGMPPPAPMPSGPAPGGMRLPPSVMPQKPMTPTPGQPAMRKGGKVKPKRMAKGGSVSSRGDGCAKRGKTKGRIC